MLVLKLVYKEDFDFIREIQELKNILKKKKIIIGVVESEECSTHIVKIICEDECYNERVRNLINLYVSNILYKIVIDKYKEREMFDFIIDTYFFLKQDEIIEVEEQIMKVLYCDESLKDEKLIYCINKMNGIIEKIKDCIEENNEMNINGFITFRMRELREDIEEIIDKVVESYMVEKEYKEFVKLLKYFVDIQESKIDEVDIILEKGGGYSIKDSEGNDIYNEFIKELADCRVDTDANIEDVIISGLITNAPKQVIIHGKENCINREFIETIKNVFGARAICCDGCVLCRKVNIKI